MENLKIVGKWIKWFEGLKRILEKVKHYYVRCEIHYWKRKAILGHLWLREFRKLERTVGSAHYEFHKKYEHFLLLEKKQELLLNQIQNTSDLNQTKKMLDLVQEYRAQMDHIYNALIILDKKRSKIKIKVSLKDAVNRRVTKRS